LFAEFMATGIGACAHGCDEVLQFPSLYEV
jgi:hypothetical protein